MFTLPKIPAFQNANKRFEQAGLLGIVDIRTFVSLISLIT